MTKVQTTDCGVHSVVKHLAHFGNPNVTVFTGDVVAALSQCRNAETSGRVLEDWAAKRRWSPYLGKLFADLAVLRDLPEFWGYGSTKSPGQ